MSSYTRGELEEIIAGVYTPEAVTTTFDATANNGKIAAKATLTTALTGTNNDMVFTADANGTAGNSITIEYTNQRKQPGQADAECSVSGTAITVDLKTSAGVKATGTLTSSGVFQNDETVTIGDTEYTFKTALSTGPTVAYEVLIGASAAASLDNLKSAVNATAGVGTTYSVGTEVHPTVTATTNADTTQVFEAKTLGTAGNLIATTETCANNAFGGSTLAGGEEINQVLSTAAEVKTAIEAVTAAAALVDIANSGADDGSGVVTTMAATNLSGGSDGTVTLFTVEDAGLVAILGDCTVDLTGNTATLEVGVTGNTAALIPQTTATTLDDTERIDRSGVIATSVAPNVTPFFPVRAGDVIKLTVGTASITAGTVRWQMYYKQFDSTNTTATGTSSTQVQGTAAHDAADSGNPLKIGGKASAAAPTDVSADGDRVDAWFLRNGALAMYNAYDLDQVNDAIASYEKGYTPVNLTASAQLLSGPGRIKGFYVNSTSSGTIVLRDALTATTPVISGTITPAVGYHEFPANVATGAYASIGGTLDVTFFVRLGSIA